MLWIILVLAASALLAWLVMAMRRYESESATAALRTVEALKTEVEALRMRVAVLETIAAEERLPLPVPTPPAAKADDSVSSRRSPQVRS